jgi:excisionase family DNA binding protein
MDTSDHQTATVDPRPIPLDRFDSFRDASSRVEPPVGSRRLYRVPEAMRLLSLSRSVIYEQIRAGRLMSVTQGRTRLVPATAIVEYVELLMREADGGAA